MLKETMEKVHTGFGIAMNENVKVYVPTQSSEKDISLESKKMLNFVQERLSMIFGGTTTTQGVGTWINENSELIKERVYIVQAFGVIDNEKIEAVKDLSEMIKWNLFQEAVSIEINNQLYIVE